ncbi:MAG: hypothetical protein HKN29_14950 [Rhodothermales bacterium]|nr:hypothetical protein [Rhodothermales bacterium]
MIVLLLVMAASVQTAMAQSTDSRPERTLAVKFIGLSYHPNASSFARQQYSRKLSPDGSLVANLGVLASWEQFVRSDRLAIRVAGVAMSDCRSVFAGAIHVGAHLRLARLGRVTLLAGIGPTLYFRQDWHRFDTYKFDGRLFRQYADWQYIVTPIGGDLELDVRVTPNSQLSFTILPGYPQIVVLAIGAKFRI